MAMTAAERKRRQREQKKALDVQTFQMEITGTERWCIQKGAGRRGYEDQTEYLLSLVYADLEKPADVVCPYPECNCPFDKPPSAECYRGFEEPARDAAFAARVNEAMQAVRESEEAGK